MSNPETIEVIVPCPDTDDHWAGFYGDRVHAAVCPGRVDDHTGAKTMKLRKVELFTPITVDWGGMTAQHAVEAWVEVDE